MWGALSRAVRAPARLDREFFIPAAPPFALAGGPNFHSEISNVAEIGYRAQAYATPSFSVTAFHHGYDHLRSLEPAPGGVLVIDNRIEGSTNGIEAWTTYLVARGCARERRPAAVERAMLEAETGQQITPASGGRATIPPLDDCCAPGSKSPRATISTSMCAT